VAVGEVVGVILDDSTGTRLATITDVLLIPQRPSLLTLADSLAAATHKDRIEGAQFRFADVPPGVYVLFVRPFGYYTERILFELPPQSGLFLTVVVKRAQVTHRE
jgi:hypothetical protein